MPSEAEHREQARFDERQTIKAERDALRAEVEKLTHENTSLRNSRAIVAAENERLRAVVAEVRKLEAVDHGVAWPDLCHALYELDRSNC